MLDGSSLPDSRVDWDRRADLDDEVEGNSSARILSSPHSTYRVRLRLSVICPFHNEVENAGRTATAVIEFVATNPDYHFLFVDDGSTDATVRVLGEHLEAAGGSGIDLLSLGRNQGKGRALRTALSKCSGDAVCFIDGDLPYSLDHLYEIDRGLTENDIVIGSRLLAQGHGGSVARRFYGSAFNLLVRTTLMLPFRDTQAGLKGLRREVAEHLFRLQRIDGFGFDAELLFLARKFGYSVAEIPARLSPTHSYNASLRRLVVDASRMLREVAEIRRNDLAGHYRSPVQAG
jgi:glycosyltransferase involved in cell wall biosynthesis